VRFTDLFIKRPVLAIVVNLLILVGGLQALRTLKVRQYPKIESATVTVTTPYVGANADLVRGFITTPLERAIAAAAGLDYVESQSKQGLSTIQARLQLNYPASDALADISTRVDQVRADLPPEAEIPAITVERSDAQVAAMYLSFASTILDDNQVTDYLLRIVQPRLSAVEGVQRADILGGRTFAIRAWLKAERMAALNVTPSQVREALLANNYLSSVGQTKGALVQVDLSAGTDLKSVDEFRQLVIRRDGDTLVRLGDIADVVLGADTYDQEVRFSGKRAVFMGVWVLPDANNLDVIARVREELGRIQQELPTGMKAAVAFDSTKYIEDAISEVTRTLLETIGIVIVVIFLFLGSLRSVLVPVVAIPLSLIGGVFLMQAFGFTLNLLTLLAIVLSVGLVVDDAIVVVENVERHMRDGKTRVQAALAGAHELVGPIIAMTITLVAVYAPIGFQGGLTGALFREFAFTLAGSVLISGVVALTLSPVMCTRLLREEQREGWLTRTSRRAFEKTRDGYSRALAWTMRSRPAAYIVWGTLSLAVVPLYMFSPKELAPNEDQGVVFTSLEAPANASIEQMTSYTDALQRIFAADPAFDHSFGITFTYGGFGGFIAKPWSQRRPIAAIQQELTAKAQAIAGVRAPLFLPPALPSAGFMPVEVVLASTASHQEIMRFTDQLIAEAQKSGLFAFPPIADTRIDQLQTDIVFDRNKVAALGLDMRKVGADLSALLGGNFVNRFSMYGRSYKVIPQLERKDRLVPSQLLDVHIGGPAGTLIPLGAVATLKDSVQPRTLNRFQQLNAIKLSGMATRSLSDALAYVEDFAAKKLPAGYHLDYTGESRQLREEGSRFLPAMGLAVLLIFLVLAAQFDSFRDPFVILAGSVPLAMFGALIFTFAKFVGPPGMHFGLTEGWSTTLNIYSQVGLVTLVGLIAKNGILIVEFANARQLEGHKKIDAVQIAARTRLRPILMTTAATVAGHFPLTLVSGPGAAARNSIGLVLVGGMSIGTLFTLFVVPAVYVLIAREHRSAAKEPERNPSPALPDYGASTAPRSGVPT
jgi:multidrug efflux pump